MVLARVAADAAGTTTAATTATDGKGCCGCRIILGRWAAVVMVAMTVMVMFLLLLLLHVVMATWVVGGVGMVVVMATVLALGLGSRGRGRGSSSNNRRSSAGIKEAHVGGHGLAGAVTAGEDVGEGAARHQRGVWALQAASMHKHLLLAGQGLRSGGGIQAAAAQCRGTAVRQCAGRPDEAVAALPAQQEAQLCVWPRARRRGPRGGGGGGRGGGRSAAAVAAAAAGGGSGNPAGKRCSSCGVD